MRSVYLAEAGLWRGFDHGLLPLLLGLLPHSIPSLGVHSEQAVVVVDLSED